jgi:hypothetical protein
MGNKFKEKLKQVNLNKAKYSRHPVKPWDIYEIYLGISVNMCVFSVSPSSLKVTTILNVSFKNSLNIVLYQQY